MIRENRPSTFISIKQISSSSGLVVDWSKWFTYPDQNTISLTPPFFPFPLPPSVFPVRPHFPPIRRTPQTTTTKTKLDKDGNLRVLTFRNQCTFVPSSLCEEEKLGVESKWTPGKTMIYKKRRFLRE